MKAPLSWLRDHVAIPADTTVDQLKDVFVRAGIEVEAVQEGTEVTGPVVVGKVLYRNPEEQKNGKTINWCVVDVGSHNPEEAPKDIPEGMHGRGIICGAHNFDVGDHVVVALPGAVLPGDFAISSRKTYGHVSDGMICSQVELGLPDDGTDGIIVLGDDAPAPGTPAMELLGADEVVFDLEVTPDMPHCLSMRGLARELAQGLGVEFTDPVTTCAESASGSVEVRIEDDRCARFVAAQVTGIDATRPSPDWMRRRIAAAGMRPISLPVDITNYLMLETGQPLHGYDADKVRGAIVVRDAVAGEKLTTLDGQTRTLRAGDLVIADDSGAIGMAGVMGGAATELSDSTTKVIIEGASFDRASVSRTARSHHLPSEASRRFERGVDTGAAHATALRAARMFADLAGGTMDEAVTVEGDPAAMPSTVMALDLPTRVLGMDVPHDEVIATLTGAGVHVEVEGTQATVTPPTWRPDLRDPYDYVEEVGQKVGLDRIEGILPSAPGGRGYTPAQAARRAVGRALASSGLVEVLTFPFQSDADLDKLGITADDPRRRTVRLANPLAETSPWLRTTVLPGLLAAAGRNLSRGQDDLALYEIGSVFFALDDAKPAPMPPVDRRPTAEEFAAIDAALPKQPRHLGVLLHGAWRAAGWNAPAEPVTWRHAMGVVELIATTLGVELVRRQAQVSPFHPGRCAEVLVDGAVVGLAGELHPSVVEAHGLQAGACAVELDLDAIVASQPGPGVIPPLSTFPVAKEDVALVVDEDTAAADVAAALREGGGDLLESVRLFDVYTGDQISDGKKSLAFALRLRGADTTLTDQQAAEARDAAVAVAAERFGAELRS